MKVNVLAPANMVNSSSNPDYMQLSASNYANDAEQDHVMISGINIHDENLNVVMRGNLAQPLCKRFGSRFMFRIRNDF
jgi:hypothetical protein